MNLEGQVVLITGAFGGLGSAVTPAFLRAGATVVAVSRAAAAPPEIVRASSLAVLPADLADAAQVEQAVAQAVGRWGRIDALVHLAGGFAGGQPLADTPPEELEEMLQRNLRPTFLCCRAVVPPMLSRRSGRIVCTAARAALQPPANVSAYAAAKAGVVALVQTLARELEGTGVTANAIAPGVIDTAANRAAMPDADPAAWTAPADIARVLLFLASPESAAVNGAVIPV